MPFICAICISNLTPDSEHGVGTSSAINTEIVVTTLCGHVFHQSCLHRAYKIPDVLGNCGTSTRKTVCPTCNAPVDASKLVRIYPSEDDSDDINAQTYNIRRIQQLKEQISNLTQENSSLQNSSRSVVYPWIASATVSEPQPFESLKIEEMGNTNGGLKTGDSVVWLQQVDKPEVGTVMWVGKIDGKTFAGINFDNRIGNNFPESKQKILFSCVEGHGRLVPVEELISYYDFYDTPSQHNGNERSTRNEQERQMGESGEERGTTLYDANENSEENSQKTGFFGFLIALFFIFLALCIEKYK